MVRMDTKQRIMLQKKLEAVLVIRDDGFVEYLHGYSDTKVGEELGIPDKPVGNHRVMMFGKLYTGANATNATNDEIARIKKHLNGLCCSLGYARID